MFARWKHLSLQQQRSKQSCMQRRLQGSPPKEAFTRLITRAAAELAPVAAAVALAAVETSFSQLYVLAGSICPCSNNGVVARAAAVLLPEIHAGDHLQVCSGDFEAIRPRKFSHASSRVRLAELAPVAAAVALAVVGDFLLPAPRLLTGSVCPGSNNNGAPTSMQWRLRSSPPEEVFTCLITRAVC